MGEPCHHWFSDMGGLQDDDFFDQYCHKINSLDDEELIFQEIMHDHDHHPPFSSKSSIDHSSKNQTQGGGGSGSATITNKKGDNTNNNLVLNNNNNCSFFSQLHIPLKPSTSCILSFDDSIVVATTREEALIGKQPHNNNNNNNIEQVIIPSSKGVIVEKHEFELAKANQAKKEKRSRETLDHIFAERKRRRELSERFIQLSASIPGLKKSDKSTILSEAINHVKQLKERVRELEEEEQQSKKITMVESVTLCIHKSHDLTTNNNDEEASFPTVEARVLKRDLLIRIHCKKQSGIVLRILAHLKSLQYLSTISNSVLPFGNSTIDISIIAQMGDKFNVTISDLVKNLRVAILESPEVQQ